jgi:hypothetical protein
MLINSPDGGFTHLDEFQEIVCISNAQVFGKVDAMLEYRIYPASSMMIDFWYVRGGNQGTKTNRLQKMGSGFEARRIVLIQALRPLEIKETENGYTNK